MWRLLLIGLVWAWPLSSDVQTNANQFADAYNTWVNLQRGHGIHVVDAREIRAWKEVQEQWKRLDRSVKYTASNPLLP